MMQIGKLPVVAFIVGLLCRITLGQNITASTCASPGGFRTCMETVASLGDECVASYHPCTTACYAACGCGVQIGQLRCALQNCWNVVYGCEYQAIAAQLVSSCFADAENIPFFPAPDSAPGGCSCNLGYISGNITNVGDAETSCYSHSTGNIARTVGCACCKRAGVLTSIYSICPDVSLSYLGKPFPAALLANADLGFSSCRPSFSQFDCVEDLSYPPIAMFPYVTTIPTTSGTATPSTTGRSLTSPVSSLIVYTLGGTTATVTPVAAGSNPTGSAPRIASTSAGFFNTQLLIVCTAMLCYWI